MYRVREIMDQIEKPNGLYPNYLNPRSGVWGSRKLFNKRTCYPKLTAVYSLYLILPLPKANLTKSRKVPNPDLLTQNAL